MQPLFQKNGKFNISEKIYKNFLMEVDFSACAIYNISTLDISKYICEGCGFAAKGKHEQTSSERAGVLPAV